jgi:two-component system alkaline phosphatase synthesis response regulator PhoP
MDKLKVLVVDDEPEFVELIKLRLECNGYDVTMAFDGNDGLKKIKKEKPDAVLLDILMPGLDGIEVLKRIRRHNKDLPVFIVTAFSNEERFDKAKKYNVSGFITKTSDLKQEVANITSAIRISSMYKSRKHKLAGEKR